MSGLLPRTQNTQNQGNFENLSTGTLLVNTSAYIQSLTTGTFTPADITVSEVTGNPDLNIAAGVVTVNSDVVITEDATQILTNKTLTSPVISTIVSGVGTLTLPTTTGTIALTSDIPSLTNYVTLDGTQTITGTKSFQNAGTTTNGFYAIGTNPGGNSPVTAGVFLGKNTSTADYGIEIATQLNIDKSYIDFTHVGTDYTGRIIMDHSTNGMDIITPSTTLTIDNKFRTSSDLVLTATPATNNTSDVLARTSAGDVVIRSDVVTLAGTQTLTNKTLTTPTMSTINSGGGTLTLPTTTGTVLAAATPTTTNSMVKFSDTGAAVTGTGIICDNSNNVTGFSTVDSTFFANTIGTSTVTVGPAAGTGGAITYSKLGASCGFITITTGTTPLASSVLFTVVLGITTNGNYIVTLNPYDSNSSRLATSVKPWVLITNATTFTVNQGTALTASTTYSWSWVVTGLPA